MEEWTIGTDHRLCCIKCGHLFGRSCIERWIKEKGASAKCPSCNKPTKRVDIRDLWCKAIKAKDTTELSNLQQLLDNERKLRKTDSATIFHQNLKYDMLVTDVEKLKANIREKDQKIARLEKVIATYTQRLKVRKLADNAESDENVENVDIGLDESVMDEPVVPQELKGVFHFLARVESDPNGGCKVFALCPTSSLILVAQPSPSALMFGGHGIKKFSTIDTSVSAFIPLHTKPITSIQLKSTSDLVLTSGSDKRVRMTSIRNHCCVQTYQCTQEPVCVAWSTHHDQQFYVGSANCFVSLYDMRNTSEQIYTTSTKVASTRLMSMTSVTTSEGLKGVLVNDTRSSHFLEVSSSSGYEDNFIDLSQEHLKAHSLPFEGTMGSVDYHQKLDLALVSTRKPVGGRNTTHSLVRLEKTNEEQLQCKNVRAFLGGTSNDLFSQSRILKHPAFDNSVLVGHCDNDAKGIILWDSSDNSVYQRIKIDAFVRDMIIDCPENTNRHLLYTLDRKHFSVYRWDYA